MSGIAAAEGVKTIGKAAQPGGSIWITSLTILIIVIAIIVLIGFLLWYFLLRNK